MGKPLHLDKSKWNIYNFRSRTVSSQTAELPSCASSLLRQRKRRRGGKKVRARALRKHTALENLPIDATQQPLEFYDSRLSAQAAAVTPVVSPVVLLGSLPVVPPLPRRHQRLAATNCLIFLTALTPTLLKLMMRFRCISTVKMVYFKCRFVLYCCPDCTYIFRTARAW